MLLLDRPPLRRDSLSVGALIGLVSNPDSSPCNECSGGSHPAATNECLSSRHRRGGFLLLGPRRAFHMARAEPFREPHWIIAVLVVHQRIELPQCGDTCHDRLRHLARGTHAQRVVQNAVYQVIQQTERSPSTTGSLCGRDTETGEIEVRWIYVSRDGMRSAHHVIQ